MDTASQGTDLERTWDFFEMVPVNDPQALIQQHRETCPLNLPVPSQPEVTDMTEKVEVRDNCGKCKLTRKAACSHCNKSLSRVKKYRVRTVESSGCLAFYYSHTTCPKGEK